MSPVTPLGHQNSQDDVRGPHTFNERTRSYEPNPEFEPSEFPKHLYRLGIKKSEPLVVSILVKDQKQEDALKGEWFAKPGDIPAVADLLARGMRPPVANVTMASEYAPDEDEDAPENKAAVVRAPAREKAKPKES